MEFTQASLNDIELLTATRVEVLRAANRLSEDVDMNVVEQLSRIYYERSLADGSHAAYLVFDGKKVVGAGGVSFFKVMPTYHNPSGEKAYIMNMYTHPDYRRRGIAYQVLDLLVAEARKRGIAAISLESTDMGRPLYEKYGFVPMEHEMELSGETY